MKYLLLGAVLLLLLSCVDLEKSTWDYVLPLGSHDVQEIDKHWCYFVYDGKKFLMYVDFYRSALTEIIE